jgi:NTE family protein
MTAPNTKSSMIENNATTPAKPNHRQSRPAYLRAGLLALGVLLLAGCSTLSPVKPVTTTPAPAKPKIGLALGGGAARGFAHIGVIKMLESQGIVPDYVVGTSAGAVVGALYAGGHDAYAMQKIAQQLDETLFADWTLGGRGFLKGESLQGFVNQHLKNRPLEKLNKPFAVVATDLKSGERVVFRSGDTGLAVRASAAVPGIFQPTQFRGKTYVDGGLSSPVPVQAAREMGADFVIAVDISEKPDGQPVDSLSTIMWQTITIMGGVIGKTELQGADVVIRPNLPYVKSWDFKARHDAILEGERAAQNAVPLIRQKLPK